MRPFARYLIIFIILGHSSISFCRAQTTLDGKVITQRRDTTILAVNDSLRLKQTPQDTATVNNIIAVVDSLKHLIKEYDVLLASKNSITDSLGRLLSAKDVEIKQLREDRAFVDTCMARLANRWLFEKYNEQDVNDAIGYFDRILSTQLRRDRSVILQLLKNYKSSYMDFQEILKTAQRDQDRENPFMVEEYKTRYKTKVESMSYYVQYFKGSWNIRYLNERIEDALARIEAHSTDKPADFSDLID